jgi:hypothetical protein
VGVQRGERVANLVSAGDLELFADVGDGHAHQVPPCLRVGAGAAGEDFSQLAFVEHVGGEELAAGHRLELASLPEL